MLQIKYIDPRKLKPYPGNNVKHPESQIQELVAAIEEFGFTKPVGVDANLVLVYGHGATEAAIRAGLPEIPTVDLSYLSERQKRAYRIADNKIARNSVFDFETIASEVEALIAADFDIDLLGFNEQELDAILKNDPGILPTDWNNDSSSAFMPTMQQAPAMADNPDEYEELEQMQVDVQPGDLIEIGVHRLMCGDSTEPDDVSKLFGDTSAQAMITDPPYGVKYVGKTKDALTIQNDALDADGTHALWADALDQACTFVNAGGSVYATVPPGLLQVGFMQAMVERGILRQCMVWDKGQMVLGHSDYHYAHEPILYGWMPGASHYFTSDRTKTTVFRHPKPARNAEHPTMKPIGLCSDFVSNSTKEGWIIYDPFGGSGTTMIVANSLNRVAYIMEISPRYCQVIINRMLTTFPGIRVKINGQLYESR